MYSWVLLLSFLDVDVVLFLSCIVDKPVEALVPNVLVEVQELVCGLERGPVHAQIVDAPLDAAMQESGRLEHLQVFRDAVETHIERLRNVSNAELAGLAEKSEDASPRRVTQRVKYPVEVFFRSIVNHVVEYMYNQVVVQ